MPVSWAMRYRVMPESSIACRNWSVSFLLLVRFFAITRLSPILSVLSSRGGRSVFLVRFCNRGCLGIVEQLGGCPHFARRHAGQDATAAFRFGFLTRDKLKLLLSHPDKFNNLSGCKIAGIAAVSRTAPYRGLSGSSCDRSRTRLSGCGVRMRPDAIFSHCNPLTGSHRTCDCSPSGSWLGQDARP